MVALVLPIERQVGYPRSEGFDWELSRNKRP